ncbi:hypothetical protein NDR87_11985 [Nocardia sp. CDC159]|uniref:Uncharacterized protein n=1 Tax=Nocardia pulmonis TaxID=2951408 RepID=A0A9X2E4K1_9NOCA|nr:MULTISPECIES: hypothetical protein [Nocardia]MCM6774192.1 hypothetical protein [Nocardia pulmonis]MCM6787079.1 hypothetical protein [Nocardia sp. CDC159]
MFRVAVLIPSPPVLVPELCGGRPLVDAAHPAARVPALREAVLAAGRALAERAGRWVVIGVGERPRQVGPEAAGTFRGFGADVRVGLSDAASSGEVADANLPLAVLGGRAADPMLPLPALIGGWLRGQVAPAAVAEARIVAADAPAARCLELGAKLRAELDEREGADGVLVVADGAATLSVAAPGYLDPRAAQVQDGLDRALAAGDREALARLDSGLCAELEVSGRAAFQVLAGLFDTAPEVETHYRDAPFGVGYQVSVWLP